MFAFTRFSVPKKEKPQLIAEASVKAVKSAFREDEEGNEFLMYYLEGGNACALSMMCSARNEQSQVMAKAMSSSEVLMIPVQISEQWLEAIS